MCFQIYFFSHLLSVIIAKNLNFSRVWDYWCYIQRDGISLVALQNRPSKLLSKIVFCAARHRHLCNKVKSSETALYYLNLFFSTIMVVVLWIMHAVFNYFNEDILKVQTGYNLMQWFYFLTWFHWKKSKGLRKS